jgi:hypothetical protein
VDPRRTGAFSPIWRPGRPAPAQSASRCPCSSGLGPSDPVALGTPPARLCVGPWRAALVPGAESGGR